MLVKQDWLRCNRFGVVYERHHAFKVDELWQTIKENSLKDMFKHVVWILGGK